MPGVRCSTEDAKRRAIIFFRVVDVPSESSEIPQLPEVPDDLRLHELNDGHNWGLEELDLPGSRSKDTRAAMKSLRSKLENFDKSRVHCK